MSTLYAKYGLQGQSFAILPTLKAYRLLKQKPFDRVIFDIQKEISLLASMPGSTLRITVPTIGFTDLILDYAPWPRFAIPLSVNGYVANENNKIPAKIMAWGKDIAGNDYPLLTNPDGKIDLSLIEMHRQGQLFFTTLDSISYVFSMQQLQGCDLVPSFSSALVGKMEWLLFYRNQTPLIFLMEVLNQQGEILQTKQVGYYPTHHFQPKAYFFHHREIHCEAKVADPNAYFRACWEGELLLKDSMVRIKHYAGLSYTSLSALLMHLIPLSTFFERLTQYPQGCTQNRYDQSLSFKNTFYRHLINSILDQSLPLMALQAFFNENAHESKSLEQLSSTWDEQDRAVFKAMLRQPSLETFVDALDEFISLREPLFNATFQLPV
ncbi:hypothetical protein [Candidatus Berkiella aquae]|uniref:Uncharacterized protein n=1 Tax=Candidatus Berkiella aquae TaxID=295108 RepID=A0A0Q9YFM8_9GAMM|nr:hypothetical protein [Candidatus Berkiella aquae]MCS5709828.1 hypothetical protein [Candidatus Berkiella aquae]